MMRAFGGWILCLAVALLVGCGEERATDGDGRVAEHVVQQRLLEQEAVAYETVIDSKLDGPRRELRDLPFDLSWDLPLEAPVHASWISPETKDLLMVQLVTGDVVCFNIYTGMTKWRTMRLPKPIALRPYVARHEYLDTTSKKVVQDDRLYIISGDELFVFDCSYGQLIWRHHIGQNGPFGFQPSTGPFAMGFGENLRVFIGDWDGRIRVISRHEGKARSYHAWQWNLTAVPTAQATGKDDLVYVGDRSGTMTCFQLNRDRQWQFEALAPIEGAGLVRGYNFYFGANDGVFHVLNRLTGREMGDMYIGAPIRRQPFAYDNEPARLYFWVSDHPKLAGLYKIRTADDRIAIQDAPYDEEGGTPPLEVNRLSLAWQIPGLTNLVGSSPDKLYVTRPNSTVVVAIDRSSGTADWHWDLNDGRAGDQRIAHLTYYHDATDDLRSIVTIDHTGRIVVYRLFGHQ